MAVPKFLKYETYFPVFSPTARAKSIPLPSTTMSMSLQGLPRKQSLT